MRYWSILTFAALLLLAGCGKFFPKDTGGGGGGTTTGNYLYVANFSTSLNTIAGFSIGTSALSSTSSSPYSLGFTPSAVAITPNNGILYVGTLLGIYAYSINSSTGALSVLNNGSAVTTGVVPGALKVDTTGNWLVEADEATLLANVYAINSSTGLLTQQNTSQIAIGTGSPNQITFTPNNSLVYIANGSGGTSIFSFSSSTGTLTNNNIVLKPKQTNGSATSVAVSPSGTYLFVAETVLNGVRVLTIGSGGSLNEVSGSPYTTALGPSSVLVDSTGSYVYVANKTAGTISAFTLASATGALTQITGSPFDTGTSPLSLAEDSTHAYIAVACSGGSPDLQVFKIDTATPGALDTFKTASTGTSPTSASIVVATNATN